eukprot:TRINITY_DN14003_c0_g1_i1.p2 TRINITY_DN14003_c0_g1~~TRINITY_DN14003_c0_g1_i1.p2  ORF type:complete len:283 (+),score=51.58 TRINITY_DN14003_c0_g1_i1:55-903(+)
MAVGRVAYALSLAALSAAQFDAGRESPQGYHFLPARDASSPGAVYPGKEDLKKKLVTALGPMMESFGSTSMMGGTGGAEGGSQGEEDAGLRRKCDYLARAKQSNKYMLLKNFPKMKALEKLCHGRVEASADAAKERLETRCAWLKKLVNAKQMDFLESQPWFHALNDMCSSVPEQELLDNALEVDEHSCVWLMLLKSFGKSAGHIGGPALEAKEKKCGPESRRKAAALATKVGPLVQMAEKMATSVTGSADGANFRSGPQGFHAFGHNSHSPFGHGQSTVLV